MTSAVLALPVPAAAAVRIKPPTVSASPLTLLGASQGRFALLRDNGIVMSGTRDSGTITYVGHYGRQHLGSDQWDLRGDVLRWSYPLDSKLYTLNLADGKLSAQRLPEWLVAFTPQGWIGSRQGTLTEHRGTTSTVLLRNLPTDYDTSVISQVVSDGDRTLVVYRDGSGPQLGAKAVNDQTLVLVSDKGKQVRTLARAHGDHRSFISGLALTPGSEVWSVGRWENKTVSLTLYRRDLATENVMTETVSVSSPQDYTHSLAVVAADEGRIVLEHNINEGGKTRREIRIWDGNAWVTAALPSGATTFSALVGVTMDDGRLYAASGRSGQDTAGLYEIAANGQATLAAALDSRPDTITDVGLGADRVTYAARPHLSPGDAGIPVYTGYLFRDLTTGRLQSTGKRMLGTDVVSHPDAETRPALSVSGSRKIYRSSDYTESGFGRLSVLARRPRAGDVPPQQSGAYFLAGGGVYLANDDLTITGPPLLELGRQPASLFGSQVVWRAGGGRVLGRAIGSGQGTRQLRASGAAGPVAVWGTRYAWLDGSGRIGVQKLTGGPVRWVPTSSVVRMQVYGEVLSWADRTGVVHLLDLRDSGTSPVTTQLHAPYQVDEDLIAGLNASGEIQVEQLPFAMRRPHPRLVSQQVPATIPQGSPWRAEFDITSTSQPVRLHIWRGRKVVRTLSGRAPGGLIHLTWNGRTGSGRPVRPGRFRWTLTALQEDTRAPLTRVDGGQVSGTLRVTAP